MGVNSSISLNSETVYNSNVSAQPGGGSGRSWETPFHSTEDLLCDSGTQGPLGLGFHIRQ